MKKLQSANALSHAPSSNRGEKKTVAKLTEKERQTIVWQHSKSGASLNTVQALSRFFERLGQSVSEEEITAQLPSTWVEGGPPVVVDFVLDVMTKKKQTFDLFRHDPDDVLNLFVSFGGNPDRTGTVDAAEIIGTMKSYDVKAQVAPLTKPRLTYGEFNQFMSSLKASLSDDVAATPHAEDLPLPIRGRRQSLWMPNVVVTSASDNSMDDLSRAFSTASPNASSDPMVTNMETSFAFVDDVGDASDDESSASPLRRFITAAVQMHDKRMKTIDNRRNETRAQMEELSRRLEIKPIRFNGQLSAPPKKKFTGTKCIPPVMLLREEFKMEQLLADVEEAAHERLKLMLLPRPSTPGSQRPLSRPQSAAPRPSSAASSRSASTTSGSKNVSNQRAGGEVDDPMCELIVRDIARHLERSSAASEHKSRIAQKKKEIELARAAAARSADFCLSEADVVLPQGFEGVPMGLKIVESSRLPLAKLPNASTLRKSTTL